jgi:hypothetical protein
MRIWAQESRKTKLGIKRYGLGSFQGKMVFLGGFGVVLKFLKWLGGLWHKRQGSCEIWNFYGIFFYFWRGSEPICNYFLKAEGPAINSTNSWGP